MKNLSKIIPIIPVLIYAISITQNAFKTEFLGKIVTYESYSVLLMGGIGFLGGGIFEAFVWSANVWFFMALLFTKKNKTKEALIFSVIAMLISTSFMLWKEVLASESGSTAKIISLELGYFLWISSMIFLFLNSVFLFLKRNNT